MIIFALVTKTITITLCVMGTALLVIDHKKIMG